ncbi:MAG TPA: hypothetical protein VF638_00775 [Sphingomonas sp.]|jgi:hypothetical protein
MGGREDREVTGSIDCRISTYDDWLNLLNHLRGLGMSTRLARVLGYYVIDRDNVLKGLAGLSTLSDLELRRLPNFGEVCFAEFRRIYPVQTKL